MQEFNKKITSRKVARSVCSDDSVAHIEPISLASRNSHKRDSFSFDHNVNPKRENSLDILRNKSVKHINRSAKSTQQSKYFSSSSCDSDDSDVMSDTSNPNDALSSELENPRSRSLSLNKVDTLDKPNFSLEAQANRKILDLEISNKSLNAINQIFESKLVHRAAEIEALKKKILALSSGNFSTSLFKKDQEIGSEGDEQIQRLSDRFDFLIDDARSTLSSSLDNSKIVFSEP